MAGDATGLGSLSALLVGYLRSHRGVGVDDAEGEGFQLGGEGLEGAGVVEPGLVVA
jgi:hypothetical protein